MKKINLALFLTIFASVPLFSQNTLERRKIVGINVLPGINTSAYFIVPRIGYKLTNNFQAGVDAHIARVSNTLIRGGGIYGRFYVGKGSVSFFPHLGIGYEQYQKDLKINTIVTRPGLGLNFGKSDNRFGFEVMVEKPLAFSQNASTIAQLKSQFNVTIGLQFKF